MTGHKTACGADGIPGGDRFARAPTGFVDVHCHCLPHLDDGPASLAEAIALCRGLAQDHVSTVVATPHQLGPFENRARAAGIRQATCRLNEELATRGIALGVLPGAEVRVDERVDALLARDEILTLADAGRHLLLELPWDVVIDIEPLLLQLAQRGVQVILAHPERNIPLLRRPVFLRRWLACGVGLQITAASLAGGWGRQAKRAAWELVMGGPRVCIATDAHGADGSRPMTTAFNAVAARGGDDLAYLLCVENPVRVTRGERLAFSPARHPRGISKYRR